LLIRARIIAQFKLYQFFENMAQDGRDLPDDSRNLFHLVPYLQKKLQTPQTTELTLNAV